MNRLVLLWLWVWWLVFSWDLTITIRLHYSIIRQLFLPDRTGIWIRVLAGYYKSFWYREPLKRNVIYNVQEWNLLTDFQSIEFWYFSEIPPNCAIEQVFRFLLFGWIRITALETFILFTYIIMSNSG